jgi:tyrosyl-tRNA synthetase
MNDIDALCRNAVDVIDRTELERRLKEGKSLRIKAGFDPSAPDIHLGHTVLLRKLRQFQDLGHKVIFIVGDFTAMIGDPTGQTRTRPSLSDREIVANAKTYQTQAFKILDKDPKKIEVVRNSEWLAKLSLPDFLRKIASRATVARILERDDFEKRLADNQPLSMLEILYPLFQGYDSVVVKADIELGGTDQKFNLLMGRNMQKSFGQRQQIVMTLPLLVGLDGTLKMSKSLGNYIAVTESAKEMFGKIMSIPDQIMPSYFRCLTEEFDTGDHDSKIKQLHLHPKEQKINLAKSIITFYHGPQAAETEATQFDKVFSKKENPDNPDELKVPEKEIWIAELLKRAGVVASTSDAKRMIEQGAVSIDGQKVSDFNAKIIVAKGSLLKLGKKKFMRIV